VRKGLHTAVVRARELALTLEAIETALATSLRPSSRPVLPKATKTPSK
jgi:hypothetical protein